MHNPFRKPEKGEISKREELIKEAQETIKSVALSAQKCLASPLFDKYRKDAENARRKLYQLAEEYKNSNPTEYAFVVSAILSKTSVLTIMLDDVKEDASQKVEEKPKKEETK